MITNRVRWIPPAAIAVFSLLLNLNAFFIPHGKGDEVFYVGTALKLQTEGIAGYNLRHLQTHLSPLGLRQFDIDLQSEGEFLFDLKRRGIQYYDEPLFTTPPLFSFAILASHSVFVGRQTPYYLLPWRGFEPIPLLRSVGLRRVVQGLMRAQGYAVILPIAANIGLLLGIYWIGSLLFDRRAGFLAALIAGSSPILILCTHKIWADNMNAMWVTGAMLFYLTGRLKRRKRWSVPAGMMAGLAMLTKQTGLFTLPLIGICAAVEFALRLREGDRKAATEVLWSGLVFALTAAAVGGGWYALVAWHYGHPLYSNNLSQPQAPGDWFDAMRQRSSWIHIVNFPVQSPIIALSLMTFFKRDAVLTGLYRHRVKILWFWFFIFMILLWRTGELRYQLPSLGPIAILAAASAERLRIAGQKFFGARLGLVLWVILVTASVAFSCWIGLTHAWRGEPLIRIPF